MGNGTRAADAIRRAMSIAKHDGCQGKRGEDAGDGQQRQHHQEEKTEHGHAQGAEQDCGE